MPEIMSPTATATDEELVRLALRDPSAYGTLMERYESKLARYVARLARLSADDTADVLQESFIKAYQNLNDFDLNLKFSSWMYRIVHNQTISFLRKRKPIITLSDENGDGTQSILDELRAEGDIEAELDQKNLSTQLRQAIDRLDEKYRSILILRYIEEKDYKEISDILRIPIGTVGTLISRAKKKLSQNINIK